jgi:hypothetical protein
MADQKVAIALHNDHRYGLSKTNTCQRGYRSVLNF